MGTNTLGHILPRFLVLLSLFVSVASFAADDHPKMSCVGTPTGKLMEIVGKRPDLFHVPDGVDLKKIDFLHHPPEAGRRKAEWKEAAYTKDEAHAQLVVHSAVQVDGKLFYVEAESSFGGKIVVDSKARVWSAVEVMRFPDDGKALFDKEGLKTVSTKENPIYLKCAVGADILKDSGSGLVSHSKVGGGVHAHAGIAKAKVGLELEVGSAKIWGDEKERSCMTDSFFMKLPPGTYTNLFAQAICRQYLDLVKESVIEDRARIIQGDLVYLDKQSNCARDSDCKAKDVDVTKAVNTALGPRPRLPIPNAFLPDRDFVDRPKILEGRDTYDLAKGHLLGESKTIDGRAYPACLPSYNSKIGVTQYRCGVGLKEGAVCFRTPALSKSTNVSAKMEQLHSSIVGGLRWDFQCTQGLLCYAGRCRAPGTIRTLLYYNKDVPSEVRTALAKAQTLKQLEAAVDQVPAKATPEYRILTQANDEIVGKRKDYYEGFAKKTRPYPGGLMDPAERLKSDFHALNKLFSKDGRTGKSKLLDLGPKEAKSGGGDNPLRPYNMDRYLLKGSLRDVTELERILDSITYPFLRPSLLDFDYDFKKK